MASISARSFAEPRVWSQSISWEAIDFTDRHQRRDRLWILTIWPDQGILGGEKHWLDGEGLTVKVVQLPTKMTRAMYHKARTAGFVPIIK